MRGAAATAVAVVAGLAVAGPAAAIGGPIRTGEHDGFSRVVMVIEPTTEWSLELGARAATVFFPGSALAFTTDSVWQRMPRTRVTGISPARDERGTSVSLELGCECRVTASFVGARYLAIDVHDRNERTPAPAAHAPAGPAHHPDQVREDDGAAALAQAEQILLQQLARAADQGLVRFQEGAPQRVMVELNGADGAEPDPVETAAPVPAAPEPAPVPRPDPAAEQLADDDEPKREGGEEPDVLAHLGMRHPQITASSVFDRDASASVRRGQPLPHRECREDDAFDLAGWSDGRPFSDQAADLRRRAVGEFDRPDLEAVEGLVRLHIHFGLGAESLALLRGFDVQSESGELLADLARLVQSLPAEGPLAQDIACPGRHGLWLALAGRPAMIGQERRFEAVRAALEDMPPTVRRLIAAELTARFLEVGRVEQARVLHDIAARSGGNLGLDMHMRLTQARLAAAEGRPAEAEAIFLSIAQSGAAHAADALLDLVRTRLDGSARVPEQWVTDLMTVALQNRRGPREAAARALAAEALARNGDLREAVHSLAALVRDLPETRAEVEPLAARLMAAADPDIVGASAYAASVVEHGELIRSASAAERAAIAGSLLRLGLPEPALQLVTSVSGEAAPELRLVAARAHLALEQTEDALAELDGLDGMEAESLRARAYARVGDYASVAALANRSPEAALPYAWASGQWDLAANSPDAAQAVMARFMRDRGARAATQMPELLTPEAAFLLAHPDLAQPSLAAAQMLVDAGREVGGFVGALLGSSD